MTAAENDLLTTTEGVDEGSTASATEAAGGGTPTSVTQGSFADRPPGGSTPSEGVAAPLDLETTESRAARAAAPGQELAEGEG